MTHQEALASAVREINNTLGALERDTGCVVEDIGLQRVDVTTYSDEASQHRISVTIDLKRLPGHDWAT